MKIKSVRVIPHVQVIDQPGWSLITGAVPQAPCLIVAIEAADGTRGFGTVPALQPFDPPVAAAAACADYLGGVITGQPLNINARMADLDRALMGFREIKAAIEVALYDLASRVQGVSLSDYLGGSLHQKVPVARLVPLLAPDAMADFAAGLVAKGYKVLKLKFSGEITRDVARMRAVRDRVGPGVRITGDANGRYETKAAIRAIEQMDDDGLDLIEQPVPRGDREGLKLITQTVRPMVEADESAMTFEEIVGLVHDRVVDSINLRIPRLGGIRGVLAAAKICQASDIKYRFGLCLLPSHFQATALHVASLLPYVPIAHELAEHELFPGDPFGPLRIENGFGTPPAGPGVGLAMTVT